MGEIENELEYPAHRFALGIPELRAARSTLILIDRFLS